MVARRVIVYRCDTPLWTAISGWSSVDVIHRYGLRCPGGRRSMRYPVMDCNLRVLVSAASDSVLRAVAGVLRGIVSMSKTSRQN